ncbi:hypothetical protein [Luteibacter sp. UNCMF366Tsu5.1]|uniref:hypothetical protein n=1 Tax=Luteibacter sp. UNCMF366Tsu5.1 TaxID=1502758 RepID=UPI000908C1E6|nr:hypothetical protein [Luteibacter sp. UNCMF366Tsu5.1]SFW74619.1 hypothetical protein SAMN02800691_3455 [Luteibacter sp. UNCMF366Tsu5.1]
MEDERQIAHSDRPKMDGEPTDQPVPDVPVGPATPGVWQEIIIGLKKEGPLIFFLFIITVLVAGQFAYTYGFPSSDAERSEYLSYAFPSIAAVAAGMNIYARKEAFWFWLSGGFVLAGLVVFFVGKETYPAILKESVFLIGLAAIVVAVIVSGRIFERRDAERKWPSYVMAGSFLVLFVVQGSLIASIHREHARLIAMQRKAAVSSLLCKPALDLGSSLLMACVQQRQ